MQIDYALILSAGLGTRMGEIGKVIPKVLWPIYFKSMLELQIRYCQDLGVKKIYINTHFLHDEIINFLKENKLENEVTVLHEDPLLDSGGAIHNLARRSEVNYSGNLLLVNGDQFMFFNDDFWIETTKQIGTSRAVLFGIKVDKEAAYNETVTATNKLVEIRKNTAKSNDYITYSGLGLLNLKGLKPVDGISRFFETVADYKNENVLLMTPSKFEYWDFGTADIYFNNIMKLANNHERESQMGDFLKKHSAFSGIEEKFLNAKISSIDLEGKGSFSANSIVAKGIVQKV